MPDAAFGFWKSAGPAIIAIAAEPDEFA